MSREIKFRIWSRSENVFLKNCYAGEEIWVNHEGVFDPVDSGLYVYQQFTGLLDRNGKELFEGDIITERPQSNKPPHYKVVYDKDLAMFCLANVKTEKLYEDWNGDVAVIIPENLRIIGNIYENPELLK